MKYFKEMVIGALVISLILNVYLLTKMNEVENQVNYLSHDQSRIVQTVDNQTRNLQYTLDEFIREQSWISSIQMDLDGKNLPNGNALLNFDWHIKELLKDSEVVFHYKFGLDDQYRSVRAVDKGDGRFQATVPLEVSLGPEWYISFSGLGINEMEHREIEKIKEEQSSQHQHEIQYYVTVSNDDLLKSSEIRHEHIAYLGTQYYGLIEASGHRYDKGYYITVTKPHYYGENNISLSEVYLQKYKENRLLEEEKLTANENNGHYMDGVIVYEKNAPDEKFNYSRLVVRVVYSNGAEFERVLYSK
ncbi:hypothetical protein DS745_22360 [Anaerobacillus alkaliphilus]|uniref:Uncharacterized protein n=1 Tax=Anaerobacillus alkaliphilus TaxID=1548597 RepID=A0A4Q0VNA6_9BACI|nr:hypothetical protein [Anaerobacillus alkaliphilus]RXI96456.1 hypothetical protein DS745_22360 [Anaerobacillus alkaliphilus]